MNKKYYTTKDFADVMGVSRVTIFKDIKSGKIKAEKRGRNYIIKEKIINDILNKKINTETKRKIRQATSRAMKEYKEVFKLLGKE